MKFLYQSMGGSDPKVRDLAQQLCKLFEPLEFSGPAHLVETLKDYSKKHKLNLTMGMHSGIVNVHGETGILLRIRSMN
jgi:hypothetical protein